MRGHGVGRLLAPLVDERAAALLNAVLTSCDRFITSRASEVANSRWVK